MTPPWRETRRATWVRHAPSARCTPRGHIGACVEAPTSRKRCGRPVSSVECGLGFPVDPSAIVLLRGHEQRFREGFIASAQDLARDPSMGQLADGEIAGRLVATQHAEKLVPTIADR